MQDAWGGFQASVMIDLQTTGGSGSAILQALQVGKGGRRGMRRYPSQARVAGGMCAAS